jgi:hypothetical protein
MQLPRLAVRGVVGGRLWVVGVELLVAC